MFAHRPRFESDRLRSAIRDEYSKVANDPTCRFYFLAGAPLAARLGYDGALLNGIPQQAVASFAGVGNPFAACPIEPGASVLDVGAGAGTDALIAAHCVGPDGEVIGVDLTSAMVELARANAELAGLTNTRFLFGYAEALPLVNESVDVVISNGVLNLIPDKLDAYREMFRVLKPGGRLQISDIIVETPIPPFAKDLIHLWTDCVAGGITSAAYEEVLREAGFREVAFLQRFDPFKDAPIEVSARRFGARGVNIIGRKLDAPDLPQP